MKLTVNGESRTLADGATLEGLLETLGVARTGIAVAVNASVVRGGAFDAQPLRDGDVVEIIQAVAGG